MEVKLSYMWPGNSINPWDLVIANNTYNMICGFIAISNTCLPHDRDNQNESFLNRLNSVVGD